MKKKLTILIVTLLLILGLTASNSLVYKVYLPIMFKGWQTRTLYCNTQLYDSWGISPGYVQVKATVEYHDQYNLARVATYNNVRQLWWSTHLNRPNVNPGFDINYLPQGFVPPYGDWQSGNVLISRASWEAVTHLGGSKGYTIEVFLFPANHSPYPIRCNVFPHD
jgi:hypothetical protein